uniref:Uncharacterized protein n=1 Tax=Spermophilus dauricus TaxID=99837 RepID=A0A8C9PUD1_SPEDA
MSASGKAGSLDIIQSIEEDPLLDAQLLPHHSLQAHFRPRFHPLPTVIIANLLLFIHHHIPAKMLCPPRTKK